jgi:hypothetical protein
MADPTTAYRNYNFHGSSAGSLMCLVACLRDDVLVSNVFDIIVTVGEIIRTRHAGTYLNLDTIVVDFLRDITPYIDANKLAYCLDNRTIGIHVSRITCGPIRREIIYPVDLDELFAAVRMSCYIPIMSRGGNGAWCICCVSTDTGWYIDGGFSDWFAVPLSDISIIARVRKITIPDRAWSFDAFNTGVGDSSAIFSGLSTAPPTVNTMTRV